MSRTPQKQSGSRGYQEAWRAVNLLIRSGGSWSGRERDVCYRNLGNGRFEDTSFVTGLDSAGDGRAFATLDLNGDGALDLAVISRTAPRLQLLRNQPAESGLVVELRGSGRRSNRDAIGAVAELVTDRRRLMRTVQSGAGFLSQSSRRLHFAMEKGEVVRSLVVEWSGGNKQTWSAVPQRGTLRISEDSPVLDKIAGPVHRRVAQDAAPSAVWLVEPVTPPGLQGLQAGRKTLVNFWASWCPPCKQETTEWRAASGRFAAADLSVVIASVDEDKTKRPAAPFPLLHLSEREIAAWNLFHRHLFDQRQDIGLPTSFLLDEQGRVLKVYKGVTASTAILRDLATKDRRTLPFSGKWFGDKPQRNYVELATALAEHGLALESARYFEQAIALGKPSVEALNNYAGVLLELGELPKAEDLLVKTLTEHPRQVDALANLGTLRLKQQQPGAARELFRQVLSAQPDDALAQNGLGLSLFAAKDLTGARTAFKEAVRLNPESADYRYNLGSVLAGSGDYRQALAEFESVRRARPDSADLANNLGILYVETGDSAKGEAEFTRAIELEPQKADGYLNLAMLYARTDKTADARRVLQRLLAIRPGDSQAAKMLQDLK